MTTRRAVIAGAAALVAAPALARDPAVTCRAGHFVGEAVDGVAVFQGIRYARAARFAAPVAEPVTRDPVLARAFGPACPQRGKRWPQSEDCLTLNVWTADAAARRPVIVWVHGGAYAYGSASDPITDGHALAARGDVVVVSVNHRLNAFGYLCLGQLDPRFPDSGNAGQLDLVAALRWVRDNIAVFGGDPARVTLVGQSGGGAKIATLMAMPAAAGLFRRAVTMSGQQVTVTDSAKATDRARALLWALRVDIDGLRALPADTIVAALDTPDPFEASLLYWGPVLDGRSLTRHPFRPDAAPTGLPVDLMLGATRDETRDFTDPASPAMRDLSWDALPARLAAELPVRIPTEQVVAAYRAHESHASPADVFYAATTDGRDWRPQLIEAGARARAGRPAYVYQMDFASPTNPDRRAFHGIDIALLFGTLSAPDAWTGTGPVARALSRQFQDRIAAFATTGDPQWPAYAPPDRATMVFGTTSRVENDPRRWQRELFAPYSYIQPGT